MGDEIDGAMQQAAQRGRQCISPMLSPHWRRFGSFGEAH
jgi:hypothetical protein